MDVRVDKLNLSIMHRIVHGLAPRYLTESFWNGQSGACVNAIVALTHMGIWDLCTYFLS